MKADLRHSFTILAILAATQFRVSADPQTTPSPKGAYTPGHFTEMLREEVMKDVRSKIASVDPNLARDAVTRDDLEKAYSREIVTKNPKELQPTAGIKDPAKAATVPDLIASSDILCHRGNATLVPKGAVIQVPDRFSSRLKMPEGTQILTWSAFFALNRDWIRTVEVTRAQAEGVEPFPKATVEMMKTSKIVIVATLQGGPISMLPQVEPAPEQGKTTPKP